MCEDGDVFYFVFFFFNDTATTEIYTLSLHDALPICPPRPSASGFVTAALTYAGTANTNAARSRTSHQDASIGRGYVRRYPPNKENARIGRTIRRGGGAENRRSAIRVVSSCATWAVFPFASTLTTSSPPRRCP